MRSSMALSASIQGVPSPRTAPFLSRPHVPLSMVTTVSAPGKVLIAGGYLVLDPAYTGLVLATNARFYTSISSFSLSGVSPQVRVRSPQFQQAEWIYDVHVTAMDRPENTAEAMTLVQKTDANPFVALALLYSLHVALEFHGVELALQKLQGGMDVVIAGDNDYYSHRIDGKAPTFEQLSALPPFSPHSSTLGDVHKTGLGSSAAMTTSLVAALLLHLEVAKLDTSSSESTITTESLVLIHNVAQLAHCAAQGKVGSGFDVSASVWGSQLYRRFDPALIKDVMRTETGHRICTPDQSRPALVRILASHISALLFHFYRSWAPPIRYGYPWHQRIPPPQPWRACRACSNPHRRRPPVPRLCFYHRGFACAWPMSIQARTLEPWLAR